MRWTIVSGTVVIDTVAELRRRGSQGRTVVGIEEPVELCIIFVSNAQCTSAAVLSMRATITRMFRYSI
jgi:hypothetical protein